MTTETVSPAVAPTADALQHELQRGLEHVAIAAAMLDELALIKSVYHPIATG
jgi:hypothetical protein